MFITPAIQLVYTGSDVSIYCDSTTKVIWTKDYNVIHSDSNVLHISQVTAKQAGKYWCQSEKELTKIMSELIVAGKAIRIQ